MTKISITELEEKHLTPYYQENGITIYHGDCREVLPSLSPVDVVIADPPYGQTSLKWDRRVADWVPLLPSQVLWCFGSLRLFLEEREMFDGWKMAQDLIWQKHNGSSFHADRFRRVHEQIVQFYRGKWADIYKSPVRTLDATARAIRTKGRPTHMGHIDRTPYVSLDGGPRLQRSVIAAKSCHGVAQHPTQKPLEIIHPLIEYSCPPDGTILDPFIGSGSVLVAALALKRRAVGIEAQERYCEVAAERLRQAARTPSV